MNFYSHFTKGLSSLINYFSAEFYILCFSGAILLLFTVFLFVKNKKPFVGFSALILSLEGIIFSFILQDFWLILFISLALLTLLYMICCIPKKPKKQKEVPIGDFIRQLDKKLRENETYTPNPYFKEEEVPSPLIDKSKVFNAKKNINITHARNIIERLDYISLSPVDRAKVRETETALNELERSGNSSAIFSVNEKLASLIKILAKYGA